MLVRIGYFLLPIAIFGLMKKKRLFGVKIPKLM
jgi:hypothetical protein